MHHLPLQHLEVKVGCLGAILVYLILQVGEGHGLQIAPGYSQHRGVLHLLCRDGPGRGTVTLCCCSASRLAILCLQGPALLNTKPPGPCSSSITWPLQLHHKLPTSPTSPLQRAEEMHSPGGEWCDTHRCLSLVTRAAVSMQPLCNWMRNLVTRWLTDG